MDFLAHEQNCTSQNNTSKVENYGNYEITDKNSVNCNMETSQNNIPTTASATPQQHTCDKKNSCNDQKCEFFLQNKMLEEELLHKKAARKFAELELKCKVLELERLQWEFQRDKYQSEIRWAYDVRVMHYEEERAKRLIEY